MQNVAPQITDYCREGLAYLEAGKLGDARARFSEIVAVQPDFAPALHALGMIARQERRADVALSFAARALASAPHSPPAQLLMARTLCDLGRFPEAVQYYYNVLAQGDTNAQTRVEFGMVAERLGDEQAALAQYRLAEALDPGAKEPRRYLTGLLRRLGRLPEAERICQKRLLVTQDDAEAWFDLGNILHDAEQYDQAATAFREALKYQPGHAGALENLGNTLSELGFLDEAEACLRQAIDADPTLPGPHNGLGAVLRQRGDIVGAETCFRTTLALAPSHVEAACNLSTTLLLTGRMAEGWRHYEARWGTAKLPNRGFHQPLWTGEPLGGRTLLLHAEQGFGDALQFCRFIHRLAGANLILEVPTPLVRLMRLSFPEVAQVVVRGQTLPEFHVHCPLMSLPLLLGVEGTEFTPNPPYLSASPDERTAWRKRLNDLPAPTNRRVGLVWHGNPRVASMRRLRDLPIQHLARLANCPGLSFVSLQKGGSAATVGLTMIDWTDELVDFASTAALVAELDLVVGVDTAVIHLAGGLGCPVLLLNRFDTCWRWMIDRDDSPWYPSLQQIRQPAMGDWESVMDKLLERLNSCDGLVSAHPTRR